MGPYLRHLTYAAIFPHFAHFTGYVAYLCSEIFRCHRPNSRNSILETLAKFGALISLRFHLAPSPESSILSDTDRIGRGNLRLQDCWAELEKCYEAIGAHVLGNEVGYRANGHFQLLERVEIGDWGNEAMRTLVSSAIGLRIRAEVGHVIEWEGWEKLEFTNERGAPMGMWVRSEQ